VNPASTRPSLQTLRCPAKRHAAFDRAAAAGQRRGCARSSARAFDDSRANNPDGFAPRHAAPAPGSRDSRRRSRAWPVASSAGGHADRQPHCSNAALELATAAGMLGRSPHIADSPSMHLRAGNLRGDHPLPPATTTSAGWHLQARPATAPRASAADQGTGRGLIASARWVNSYEHTRVNSGERQGSRWSYPPSAMS
jgi:hypothetical protein